MTRRTYSPRFKADLILELIQNKSKLSELAKKHAIAPTILSRWKNDFIKKKLVFFETKNTVRRYTIHEDVL
ncbi:MAG: transposase [Chitinophagales bacterium]|nr:transposase [Chitinophagales bacterium]